MQKSIAIKVRCIRCERAMAVKFSYAELKAYMLKPSADARLDIKQRLIAGDGTTCMATGAPHHCHVMFLQDIWFIVKMVCLLGADYVMGEIRKFAARSA